MSQTWHSAKAGATSLGGNGTSFSGGAGGGCGANHGWSDFKSKVSDWQTYWSNDWVDATNDGQAGNGRFFWDQNADQWGPGQYWQSGRGVNKQTGGATWGNIWYRQSRVWYLDTPSRYNGNFNGTGGLLIIFCKEFISNNGVLWAQGESSWSGGGGGGGSINVFYENKTIDGFTSQVAGGTGGYYNALQNAGNGTFNHNQIPNLMSNYVFIDPYKYTIKHYFNGTLDSSKNQTGSERSGKTVTATNYTSRDWYTTESLTRTVTQDNQVFTVNWYSAKRFLIRKDDDINRWDGSKWVKLIVKLRIYKDILIKKIKEVF